MAVICDFICSIIIKCLQRVSGQDGWMNHHQWFLERRNGVLAVCCWPFMQVSFKQYFTEA